jgi:hypothetical protein
VAEAGSVVEQVATGCLWLMEGGAVMALVDMGSVEEVGSGIKILLMKRGNVKRRTEKYLHSVAARVVSL